MRDRKRKFEPTDSLRERLLELAGISVAPFEVKEKQKNGRKKAQTVSGSNLGSSDQVETFAYTNRTPDVLNNEAIALKRQADKASGASKYLLYLKAGLKFFERAPMLDEIKQSNAFRKVGGFMSQCAALGERQLEKPSNSLRNIEHLILWSWQVSSMAYMLSFSNRCGKLKLLRDSVAAQIHNQKDFMKFLDGGSVKYVIEEFNDATMALYGWKKSEDCLFRLKTSGASYMRNIVQHIPEQVLYIGVGNVQAVINSIRKALGRIY